jgi:hypothetical protein
MDTEIKIGQFNNYQFVSSSPLIKDLFLIELKPKNPK